MIRRVIGTAVVALFILLSIAACGLLQEPEEASGTIEAIPLEVASEETLPAAEEAVVEEVEADEPAPVEPAAEEPVAEEPVAGAPASDTSTGSLVVYTIRPEGSEVRFELDEDLRGQRKTVVGVTDQVSGELAVDFSDLSKIQAGVILVNARTLLTDNNFRNRAIANEILDTGAFEFITFAPTSVDGLPDTVDEGETVAFTITGDLTIRDITNQVTFDVSVTVDSATQLSGSASAVVQRADYDLNIPSVPNVANVEQDVELYIDFLATAG